MDTGFSFAVILFAVGLSLFVNAAFLLFAAWIFKIENRSYGKSLVATILGGIITFLVMLVLTLVLSKVYKDLAGPLSLILVLGGFLIAAAITMRIFKTSFQKAAGATVIAAFLTLLLAAIINRLISYEIFPYKIPDPFHPIIPLDDWIETAVDWLVSNFRPQFQAIKLPIQIMLNSISSFLLWVPKTIVLLGFFAIGWETAGWKIGIFSVIAMAFIGFMGLWNETMVTLAMVISAVVVCVILGVPLGILSSRSKNFEAFLRPILDAMQTTPAFVYLVPVVMLFSIGTVAGVIATIIFSMPPIIRLTNLGIRQVHPELIEAAYAFGSTKRQVLWKVQIPLAMKTIMAGLNQTIMLSLSMVVIASLIGAGGLGVPVFEGLNSLQVGLAGIGGLGIVLMAMVLDRITQALGSTKGQD